MHKKIAIVFASVLLMLTASFAPIAQAPIPGTNNIYVTTGGKLEGLLTLYISPLYNARAGLAVTMPMPFVTRAPYLSPMQLFQNFTFIPVDVDNDTVVDIWQIGKIMMAPIIHTAWVPLRSTYWMFVIGALAPGGGVIFVNPQMPGDVDCYTFNNDTGVYWDSPSQLAGTKAAESGGHYNYTGGDFVPSMGLRLPHTGIPDGDGVPGTRLWGDGLDGFGDGVPDPVGSSILMLPLAMQGYEWNGTAWEQLIAVPMPMVLTTGTAHDIVIQNAYNPYWYWPSSINGTESTEVGVPWDPEFKIVTYVNAWSNMLYSVNPDYDNDGIPDWEGWPDPVPPEERMYFTADLFYEYVEKKVRADVVIPDITCDNKVDVMDLLLAGLSFGAKDEQFGYPVADPTWDARADMDGDGWITVMDVLAIGLHFGETL